MKKLLLIMMMIITVSTFLGCSEDAEDSANSDGAFSPSDINGVWKENTTGFTVRITGVGPSSSTMGNGYVNAVGTSFPAAAINGNCMKQVEYIQGGYWNAYNQTYTTNGTWVQGSVIGLAMNDAKTNFKIGTKIYYKQ